MTQLFRSASFRPVARLIVSLLVVILILIIAVLTISWQISRGMERDIEQRLQRAISQFDATLQNAETAANAVHDYLGKTCNTETQDTLRYQVTVVPDIRTVNLATGDNVYCSSLAGKYSTSVSTSKYVGGMLLML
ncbi:MAG: CSS-motif domain-containing protein, partial [Enterobacterales bacterium]|nr:CSS-motif domain-containing protein [Enterobacterales bacterium]